MNKEIIIQEIVPLSEQQELDRRGIITSRMTSDPQPTEIHLVAADMSNIRETELSQF